MTHMYLAGMTIDFARQCPVIVLTDAEKLRALPIWISSADADAISAALGENRPARPLTHDLIQNMILKLGWVVSSVELHELHANSVLAKLRLAPQDRSNEAITFEARVSDAIALALRFQAPIFVSLELLAAASISTDLDRDEHDSLQFKRFVSKLKPSDFNRLQKN